MLTFTGSSAKIAPCNEKPRTNQFTNPFVSGGIKGTNKQSIHSHPAALPAGVYSFDFREPVCFSGLLVIEETEFMWIVLLSTFLRIRIKEKSCHQAERPVCKVRGREEQLAIISLTNRLGTEKYV